MDPSTWPHVKRIFTAASGLSRDERASYVATACNGDDSLRHEVQSLLEHEEGLEGLTSGWHAAISPYAVESPIPSVLPERIGDFRIISKLGEGASGVVYVGEQEQPSRRVAVKVLRDPLWGGMGAARLFVEAEALTRLRHPGIAGVLATGRDAAPPIGSGRAYIVLRLVDGVPITAFCQEHELPLPDVVRLMVEVCDAVRHAHQQGVIHRDLKPANILVEGGPLSPRPVVLDFGIARLTDASRTAALTMTGQILGTPAYMSPEQAAGDPANIDQLSDVYALGAIAYELLSGNPVHDLRGMDPLRGINAVREGRIVPLGQSERACRGDLETVVMKALEPDKARRYQSVSEFASDLRRFLLNETILARPPSRRYKAAMFVRRNKGIVATLTLVLVSLATALVVTTAALKEAEEAQEATQDALDAATIANDAASSTLRDLLHWFVQGEYLAGSAAERREKLGFLKNFAGFIEANQDDAGVMHDYALLLRAEGRVLVEEGRYEDAQPLRVHSEGILRTLVAADPSNGDLRADHSIAIVEIGDFHNNFGRPEAALGQFRDALAIHLKLVQEAPHNTAYLGLLADSYERLAPFTLFDADLGARRQMALEQLHAAERILAIDPRSRGGLLAAGQALQSLGHDAQHNGEPEKAAGYWERGRQYGERLLEGSRRDKAAIILLADTCCYLAQLAGVTGDYAAAEPHLARQHELAESLLELEPVNAQARRIMANVDITHASNFYRQGQMDAAERHATDSIAAWRKLLLIEKQDGPVYGLACAVQILGEILHAAGRSDEARAAFVESLTMLGKLADDGRGNAMVIITYAAALLDCPLHDLRDPKQALQLMTGLAATGDGVDPQVHELTRRARALFGDAE